MIGHKLGEFAHTKKRFTYKQVLFLGGYSTWTDFGIPGQRRTVEWVVVTVALHSYRPVLESFPCEFLGM